MQWFFLLAIGGVGYLLFQRLSEKQPTQATDADATIGVGVDVTPVTVGQDFANAGPSESERVLQGTTTGFAQGGIVGAMIGSIAGTVAALLEGPPKTPSARYWAIPYRPEWTDWIDDEERCRFYVPSPDEVSPVEINIPYKTLRDLFPGCSIENIRASGVVCWRPGDIETPFSRFLYSNEVCGEWLPAWEARHLQTAGNYSPPGWGQQPKPDKIAWHDAWLSYFDKQRSEKDATRAIMLARRIAYFDALYPYSFRWDLRKYCLDIQRNRASWSGAKPVTTSKDIPWQADGNEASQARWFKNTKTIYMLANAVKVRINGFGGDVQSFYADEVNRFGNNPNPKPIIEDSTGVLLVRGNAELTKAYEPRYKEADIALYRAPQVGKGFQHLWRAV